MSNSSVLNVWIWIHDKSDSENKHDSEPNSKRTHKDNVLVSTCTTIISISLPLREKLYYSEVIIIMLTVQAHTVYIITTCISVYVITCISVYVITCILYVVSVNCYIYYQFYSVIYLELGNIEN